MITYITGGERSGKSSFAQNMALRKSDNPIYLATAKNWDEEFNERIQRHQKDRDERWENIEAQIELAASLPSNRTVVIDCVTLWLTNIFMKNNNDRDLSLNEAQEEWSLLDKYNGHLIVISNEIGMGTHAHTKMGRDFVELQGWVNQQIVKSANEAYFLISGIAQKIK